MRIRISHATTYRYDAPPKLVTQILRLTPRNNNNQYLVNWMIDVSAGCALHRHDDAFGNIAHTFTAEGPFEALSVTVDGLVEMSDTHGLITGTNEPLPPSFYLRDSNLTKLDDSISEFTESVRSRAGGEATQLDVLHQLVRDLNTEITFDTDPTHVGTTAAEAFALKRGVCQDITHIYIGAARYLGIPARYVSGYFRRSDGVTEQDAGHAWVEAHVKDLGWVGFDPTNGVSTTDAHVRVAVGLDYLSAAPVRGTRSGGAGEELHVSVVVAKAQQQMQT
jgi:transglutaminase-like putative cysteine protease